MNNIDRLENRKQFLNQSQLYRLNQWNGDPTNLTFWYRASHHHIGYYDEYGRRFNSVFRWHNVSDKSYIIELENGLLVKKYLDNELEYLNTRRYTYNRIVKLFEKRDNIKCTYLYKC